MSRDLEDTDYYISQGGVIPVKWTSPEVYHTTTGILAQYFVSKCNHDRLSL